MFYLQFIIQFNYLYNLLRDKLLFCCSLFFALIVLLVCACNYGCDKMQHLPGVEDMCHWRHIGAFSGPGLCRLWALIDYPASEVGADSYWVVPQGMHLRFCSNNSNALGALRASLFLNKTREIPRVLRDRLDTWQSRDTLWIRVTRTHSYTIWY